VTKRLGRTTSAISYSVDMLERDVGLSLYSASKCDQVLVHLSRRFVLHPVADAF
jgi:hypothetical protein